MIQPLPDETFSITQMNATHSSALYTHTEYAVYVYIVYTHTIYNVYTNTEHTLLTYINIKSSKAADVSFGVESVPSISRSLRRA